jgi:hypothetical protein
MMITVDVWFLATQCIVLYITRILMFATYLKLKVLTVQAAPVILILWLKKCLVVARADSDQLRLVSIKAALEALPSMVITPAWGTV